MPDQDLLNLEGIISSAYESVIIGLQHQKDLYDELYTKNPSQLRLQSLQKINRKIERFSSQKLAYEVVADDLCIRLEAGSA